MININSQRENNQVVSGSVFINYSQNIFCLFLQDFVNLKVIQLLIG